MQLLLFTKYLSMTLWLIDNLGSSVLLKVVLMLTL